MLDKIKMWFHHLLNPHCAECKFERVEEFERKRDLLIDEYRELLASARLEIGRLTQALVDLTKPPEVINQIVKNDFQPLARKQRMSELAAKLTRESHEQAEVLRRNKIKETEELRTGNEINLSNNPTDEISKMEDQLGIQ